MFEEVLSNLYRIEIPLPQSPLKSLNSYLIKGNNRFLLIDAGMNREECMGEMSTSLARLNVDLKKTDFFVTHLHADHLGLIERLAADTSIIYFNKVEAYLVNDIFEKSERWSKIIAIYLANGFPADELEKAAENHPARRFGLTRPLNFDVLQEGDRIEIGDYFFRCIETPGHSPGHMCLYEASKKILIAGDHILFDITPNISFWPEMEDSLKDYLVSLRKVYPLDVNLVLPGHRGIISNHRERIRELEKHHQGRLNEVLMVLKDGAKNVWQVAPYITWNIKCKSWELFPAQQKWFAFGETLAHLNHLEKERMICRKFQGGKTVFSLK
jgi:glyoxylase-like metal-dependent hydrolase (beta-lactamase superfamily II)